LDYKSSKPSQIIVNPIQMLIIWWQCCSNDPIGRVTIMKAKLDGSDRTVLFRGDIYAVDNFAIDYIANKLIWSDSNIETLFMIDFNGNNYKVIPSILKRQEKYNSYKLSIEVFGGFIYAFERYTEDMVRVSLNIKNDVNKPEKIPKILPDRYYLSSYYLEGLRVLHSSRKPMTYNICSNSKCTHLCLPVSKSQYHCVCPQANNTISLKDKLCIDMVSC